MRDTALVFLFIASLFGLSMKDNHPVGTATINIALQFSGQPLVLAKQQYKSGRGDSLYLDLLRFYISSIQLMGKGNTFCEVESYHLIDAEVDLTPSIVLKNVPVGQYDSLSFMVGTDSLTNVSGAMGGDLDPTLGMYWAWNTGYINVKIEGRSNACQTRYHAFEFHIGGYTPPYQTARRVVLPISAFQINANSNSIIQVGADISKFFSNFNLETTHQVMIPSKAATELADYFQRVFLVL